MQIRYLLITTKGMQRLSFPKMLLNKSWFISNPIQNNIQFISNIEIISMIKWILQNTIPNQQTILSSNDQTHLNNQNINYQYLWIIYLIKWISKQNQILINSYLI
ncbi:unnamed protein product [Paramecium sonneborni]|uniref:Uncharacterized protein n=1 Tax=Paramecium sonneborni TaxID=65129 RepID=A0A8S1REC3_9CILI|nr:unnamed protein product [Paramecium sonneborni]